MYSKKGIASALLACRASAQFTLDVAKKTAANTNNPVKTNSNVVVPETDDQSFWFANFTVGGAASQELLIDTGSSDVYLNPGVYKPGAASQNQNRPFSITFSTTNSDGSGTETVTGSLYKDLVAISGLKVTNQILGASKSPTNPAPFPHDGLIGFAGQDASASGSTPWFTNLCRQKLVPACRFGLAFNTDNTGSQTLGGVDPTYANALSTVALDQGEEWSITGDIVAASNTIASDASIITDSGTSVVYGPIDTVRQVFSALNIPTTEHRGTNPQSDPSYLFGYTDCANPPSDQFGITLGGTTFNIDKSAWNAKTNAPNNCTSVLQGTNGFGESWLVGQAFFQGKYVDHDVDNGQMGWANLKAATAREKRSVRFEA